MDKPKMAALLVAHHRPGVYFRVIEEGEVVLNVRQFELLALRRSGKPLMVRPLGQTQFVLCAPQQNPVLLG